MTAGIVADMKVSVALRNQVELDLHPFTGALTSRYTFGLLTSLEVNFTWVPAARQLLVSQA